MPEPVIRHQSIQPKLICTLIVQPLGQGPYEVRDDDGALLGTSADEVKAIWSAVQAAELISATGTIVRVLVMRDGAEVEEFVAKPSQRDLK